MGGAPATDLCGMHTYFGPRLLVHTEGRGAGIISNPYDGPAVVERSTEDDLVIYFEPPSTTAGAGGATGAPPGYHATIRGQSAAPLPVVPVGTRLWLTKNPDGNQVHGALIYGNEPWSAWLWNREGETLIAGATRRGASPIPFSRAESCSTYVAGCQPGITTYYSVVVQGDSPVTVGDGQSATITLGGRGYDVYATSVTDPPRTGVCADYTPEDGTSLDVRVHDLNGITFDSGTPPACVPGNDRVPAVSFFFSASSPDYDGPVSYLGRDASGDLLQFRVTNSTTLNVYTRPELIAEPAVGQGFWLSSRNLNQVLRESQQGDVLLGEIVVGSAGAADVLGIAAASENDCAYSADDRGATTYVNRVVFGTNPPAIIRSGAVGTVSIAGGSFHAAVSGGVVALWK